jgi:hypothetical protein
VSDIYLNNNKTLRKRFIVEADIPRSILLWLQSDGENPLRARVKRHICAALIDAQNFESALARARRSAAKRANGQEQLREHFVEALRRGDTQ